MSSIKIVLPDNSTKEFDFSPTILQVAESIGPRLAKDTIGGRINGQKEIVDLRTSLNDGDKLEIITLSKDDANEVVRHSAAHILAQAVQEIWPDIQVTIGPVIDNGFYYDFYSEKPFTDDDLLAIEKKMQEIIKRDIPIVRENWDKKQAIDVFSKMGENFKVEIIDELDEKQVGVYKQGEWFDLCRGPHVQKTGQVKAIKLLSHAGSYWRGDENKAQLQRIYGTAFNDKKALKQHLHNLEEAKKRDHRKLGKELGLFFFNQLSPGGPFFTPRGSVVYNQLVEYIRDKYREHGYSEVITPQIFDVDLYHQSGHYENYRENMYFSKIDDRDFSVKPMNCPGHCLIYASEHRSYRELPFRIADFGRLHRYERSGVMHGLTRVRSFAQDDAHIFCTIEQMQEEIKGFMTFLKEVYETLGMPNYKIFLSTRPEKRMGSDEIWDKAEGALQTALENLNLDYEVNPGDGAFYGPKLDIMFVDALSRSWQLGTLQCDFNMPQAFKLKYVGDDNSEHPPVMLHRAILGSVERFIGVYLEHTAGHLPVWMTPTQVKILNLTDRQQEYCEKLYQSLKSEGIRVEYDDRSEKLGFKIREAQLQKVPYMLIIGDQELENETIAVRLKSGKNISNVKADEFTSLLKQEIENRELESLVAKKLT
ncbi:MAG: threonine--tRNA ligase [Bdellovibrionales bacterium]|nr:threonine--tRNA ligase [Bdellovibrionales bacterium]